MAADMESLLVVDGHCDSLCDRVDGRRDLVSRGSEGHLDVPRMRKAGISVQVMAMWTSDVYMPYGALRRTLDLVDSALSLEAESGQVAIARSIADIVEILASGRTALVLSIEGGEALEGSVEALRVFYYIGVRMLGLTWNRRNQLADGTSEAATQGGLSRFGRQVVDEMGRLGMVVDVSHLSPSGFWEVMDRCAGPIVASHSNSFRLCPHPRNLTDEQIKALAASGGLVGICFYPGFLDEDRFRRNIGRVADHIEHVVDLVGFEHVALGSDFDGDTAMADGLDDVTCLPLLFDELHTRGLSQDVLSAIAGGNWLRVFSRVWKPWGSRHHHSSEAVR